MPRFERGCFLCTCVIFFFFWGGGVLNLKGLDNLVVEGFFILGSYTTPRFEKHAQIGSGMQKF